MLELTNFISQLLYNLLVRFYKLTIPLLLIPQKPQLIIHSPLHLLTTSTSNCVIIITTNIVHSLLLIMTTIIELFELLIQR